VRDAAAKARIHDEILPAYLADTVKARLQQPDGTYLRAGKLPKEAAPFGSQDFLMQLAEGKADLGAIPKATEAKHTDTPRPRKRPAKAPPKKAAAAD
jgi:polyphosphate kinase